MDAVAWTLAYLGLAHLLRGRLGTVQLHSVVHCVVASVWSTQVMWTVSSGRLWSATVIVEISAVEGDLRERTIACITHSLGYFIADSADIAWTGFAPKRARFLIHHAFAIIGLMGVYWDTLASLHAIWTLEIGGVVHHLRHASQELGIARNVTCSLYHVVYVSSRLLLALNVVYWIAVERSTHWSNRVMMAVGLAIVTQNAIWWVANVRRDLGGRRARLVVRGTWLVAHLGWHALRFWWSADVERLKGGIRQAGPLAIKFTQWLSERPDLVAPHLAGQFADMLDRLPGHPFAHTEARVLAALGDPEGDLASWFSEFGRAPIASASVAQVHVAAVGPQLAARLDVAAGTRLAIKVLHPDLWDDFATDLVLVSALTRVVPLLSCFEMSAFRGYMAAQLDLEQEAANTRRFGANFAQCALVRVPTIYFASREVLLESFEPGATFTQLEAETPSAASAAYLLRVTVTTAMLWAHNYVHGDLHQGNLLYWPNPAFDPARAQDGANWPVGVTLLDCSVALSAVAEEAWKQTGVPAATRFYDVARVLADSNSSPAADCAGFLRAAAELDEGGSLTKSTYFSEFLEARWRAGHRDIEACRVVRVQAVSGDGRVTVAPVRATTYSKWSRGVAQLLALARTHRLRADSNLTGMLVTMTMLNGDPNHLHETVQPIRTVLLGHEMGTIDMNATRDCAFAYDMLHSVMERVDAETDELFSETEALCADLGTTPGKIVRGLHGFADEELRAMAAAI